MSTKFEQLLDYLVNEDHEKANELFHEIVVEKSRDIYENLIAEEDMDDEEDMEESMEDDEEMDESVEDLEDSYMMDADETGDNTDDFGGEIAADGDNFDAPADDEHGDDEHGDEGQEDSAIMDIKNAIEELEAAFAELEAAQGGEADDMDMGDEDDMGMDDEGDMGMDDEDEGTYMEGRRITREYVEKVGHDYGKAQKTDGDYAGAGTGEQQSKPVMGKSPISSGKGKPTTGATAGNILGDSKSETSEDGTKPHGKASGLVKNAQAMSTGNGNVPGGKMGVKNLSKVAGGHGAEKKGAGPGPVGSGSGDKAGQTNIDPATKRQFLPQNK
jgi:hypothetical protein